ncbi:MAG: hypothetical protein WB497_04150 [Pseudolabrys sp.]
MCAVVVRGRQYLVLKGHGKWFVKSLGRLGVPYSSEVRAIRGAVDRAQKSGKSGKPAMVALFVKHRDPKIIRDSYPPITFDLALPPGRTMPS